MATLFAMTLLSKKLENAIVLSEELMACLILETWSRILEAVWINLQFLMRSKLTFGQWMKLKLKDLKRSSPKSSRSLFNRGFQLQTNNKLTLTPAKPIKSNNKEWIISLNKLRNSWLLLIISIPSQAQLPLLIISQKLNLLLIPQPNQSQVLKNSFQAFIPCQQAPHNQ